MSPKRLTLNYQRLRDVGLRVGWVEEFCGHFGASSSDVRRLVITASDITLNLTPDPEL